jgi:hypothetical protein
MLVLSTFLPCIIIQHFINVPLLLLIAWTPFKTWLKGSFVSNLVLSWSSSGRGFFASWCTGSRNSSLGHSVWHNTLRNVEVASQVGDSLFLQEEVVDLPIEFFNNKVARNKRLQGLDDFQVGNWNVRVLGKVIVFANYNDTFVEEVLIDELSIFGGNVHLGCE